MRIAGVDIPDEKRAEIALTYIMGIGPSVAKIVLKKAKIDFDKRIRDLSTKEVALLQKAVDAYPTEGKVREQLRKSLQRLKRITSYRGLRHEQGLPVRGQKTRSNARTKRGKRKTVGALKKKDMLKLGQRTKKDEKEKS